MKKYLLLTGFSLATLSLSACSNVGTPDNTTGTNATSNEASNPAPNNAEMDKSSSEISNEKTANENSSETSNELTTYKNDAWGISFEHPKNWAPDTARAEANSMPFMDLNRPNFQGEMREAITVTENAKNLTLDQVVDEFLKERNYSEEMVTSDFEVKVGGEKTTQIKTNDFSLIYYFFLHNGKIYRLDTQDNLFNEAVLKTFKFTS